MPVHLAENSQVIPDVPDFNRPIFYSHNFCDPTTWYMDSERVTSETLEVIPGTDNKQFQADYTNWIDLSHGKVSDEDDISSSYLPVVKVDSVTKTEATPFGSGTDGDFTIDYAAGKVIFHDSVTGTVTADYSYEDGSTFSFAPDSGKNLQLLRAETQISVDMVMSSSLIYVVKVGSTPVKTKIYKTIHDFINESNKAYPTIPAFSGNRGFVQPIHTFAWDYASRTDLYDSLSMSVDVYLESHTPCTGEYAMVTFYFWSKDE
jgi:hypothetical protein